MKDALSNSECIVAFAYGISWSILFNRYLEYSQKLTWEPTDQGTAPGHLQHQWMRCAFGEGAWMKWDCSVQVNVLVPLLPRKARIVGWHPDTPSINTTINIREGDIDVLSWSKTSEREKEKEMDEGWLLKRISAEDGGGTGEWGEPKRTLDWTLAEWICIYKCVLSHSVPAASLRLPLWPLLIEERQGHEMKHG